MDLGWVESKVAEASYLVVLSLSCMQLELGPEPSPKDVCLSVQKELVSRDER